MYNTFSKFHVSHDIRGHCAIWNSWRGIFFWSGRMWILILWTCLIGLGHCFDGNAGCLSTNSNRKMPETNSRDEMVNLIGVCAKIFGCPDCKTCQVGFKQSKGERSLSEFWSSCYRIMSLLMMEPANAKISPSNLCFHSSSLQSWSSWCQTAGWVCLSNKDHRSRKKSSRVQSKLEIRSGQSLSTKTLLATIAFVKSTVVMTFTRISLSRFLLELQQFKTWLSPMTWSQPSGQTLRARPSWLKLVRLSF